MTSYRSRYCIGRFNLISAYPGEKSEYILQGLRNQAALRVQTYMYGFFDINEITRDDELYFTGFLVKYRESENSEIVDVDTREIEDQQLHDTVRTKSRFFIHVKSGIIAYNALGDIDENSFKKNFCDLFELAHNNILVDASIETINQEVDFLMALSSLDTISKVTVRLHPSNPSSREIWKRQDERLKKLGSKTYTETYAFKDSADALKIKEDQEIKSKLLMASDGYGKANIKGEKNGEKISVSTGNNPVICDVEVESEEINSIQSIISRLIPTFKSMFKRMKDVS